MAEDPLAPLPDSTPTPSSGNSIPAPTSGGGGETRAVPFSSLLAEAMNQRQEQLMVDDAIQRIDDLKAESGWTEHDNEHPDPKTWFGKREIAEKKWDGDLEFRAKANRDGMPSIFQSSNVTLDTVKHQVRDLVASVVNNTVGTKPFFTAMPVGDLEPAPDAAAAGTSPQTALAGPVPTAPPTPPPVLTAKLVEMFADDKIDASNCEESLRQGLQTTCIKGEQVYKIAHKFETNHTRVRGTVLCDGSGSVLYTRDGDVVTPDDFPDPATGAPIVTDPSPGTKIEKDPNFVVPEGAQFVKKVYERVNISYQGPDVSPIHYKSWLCPLNVDDIHNGTNVFLYDLPTEEVARLYRHPKFVEQYDRTPTGDEAAAILRDLELETSAPKTPVSMPNPANGEHAPSANDENRKVMQIAEYYDKRDVDGDGYAEEYILVLDLKNKRPLYYGYLDEVFFSGRRPFEVTTFGRANNRWFGAGLFEQFAKQEEFIDTQLNRENYRNSAAGRIDGYHPDGTEETAAGEPMAFGTGVPYKLKPNKKLADVFQSVQMPEMTDGIKELRQEMIQAVQVEGGNIGAADGATSGLNVSKTAYGVRNIEQNKDSLQGFFEDEMQKGVLDVVQATVDCVFNHMDDVERFSYAEKDKQVYRTITRAQVKGLRYKVRLSLLQKQTQQNLQNIQLAVTLGKDYLALPKNLQKALRPLYIQQGKILKIQEAETIFPDPDTLPDPPPPATPLSEVAAIMQALASMNKSGIQIAPNDVIAIIVQAGLPKPQGPVTVTPPPAVPAGPAAPKLPGLPPIAPPPSIQPALPATPPQPQLADAA